ncbi:MAG TPA: methyltransferase domain-containing protein [Dehalococcoidia bacterium]|nr:methyltransferase domain-containing protein [Dehalococcoidia bacterium]
MHERHEAARQRLERSAARAGAFSGWDLSAVRARLLDPGPPWSYEALVRQYAAGGHAALDMGTGGGEVLSSLRPDLPACVLATEEWPPNAPVAARRLAPLGVSVLAAHSLRLPFRDGAFDLVLNRHEYLDCAEIARVLHSGGHIVTQQVGGRNWRELQRFFPRKQRFDGLHHEYAAGFVAAGLAIVLDREHEYRVAYPSLSELVYLLSVMPWEIPDFALNRDLDPLLALERACLTEDGLVLTESRFIIVAQKPG